MPRTISKAKPSKPNGKAKVNGKSNGNGVALKNKSSSGKNQGGFRLNSGRPNGKSNATHLHAMITLREKIDKLGLQLGKEADPIIALVRFINDESKQFAERHAAASLVLPHIYPKFGTVEGMPDMNFNQQNNTQVNVDKLAIGDRRKLLEIGDKLNSESVIDIESTEDKS